MTEDFDNHRRIIDGGDNLQGTAAVGTVFHVDVEDVFEPDQMETLAAAWRSV
jgi:hypothetical protein